MDRIDRLLSTSTKSSRIMEIGPGYNPIAAKRDGWNCHVVDHTDQAGLREKYLPLGVDIERIEVVDTVWQGGPLDQAVPAGLLGTFDTILASHVIEHIPDFVGFLAAAAKVLAPSGTIVLAVPDPRYCFDYFKPHSTTGDVLEAHAGQVGRHSLRTRWNHLAYAATMDGASAWWQSGINRPAFMGRFEDAIAHVQAELRDGAASEYRDSHAWLFTPAAFELIMLELAAIGLVDWHIDSLHGPEGCEFIVVLRRGATPLPDPAALAQRRMALLVRQVTEQREQLDYAVAGGLVAPGPMSAGYLAGELVRLGETIGQHTVRLQMAEARADAAEQRLSVTEERMAAAEARLLAAEQRAIELANSLATSVAALDRRLDVVEVRMAKLVRLARPFLWLGRKIGLG